MLAPVTENVQQDLDTDGPKFTPIYRTPKNFDLADHVGFKQGQPFEYFRALRETAPVAWFEMPRMAGFWAVTRYQDIKAVDQDSETFSSQRGGINMAYGTAAQRKGRLYGAALNTLICLDRPYHIPLRMQHRDFFSDDYVASLRQRVEAKVDQLLDGMEAAGPTVDFVEKFSVQLPLFTLCEMLGVEDGDRAKVMRWMEVLESLSHMGAEQQRGRIHPILLAKAIYNIRDMFKYGERELQARRGNPRNDLMSAIANARVDGELLPQDFLDGAWLLIIFAGNDTTRNSLSGTMKLLTQFPEQKQKLLEDPSKISNMASEALRMVSPVIHMRRTTTCDTEIAGQKIAEGEKVIIYYGSANHDPAIFENPDRFDVGRANAKDHMAFGIGPHVCLGQRIATMQLEVAYTKILERFPNIEWTGKIGISPNNFVHAINSLEVDLGL
jgi:hypothetical protein